MCNEWHDLVENPKDLPEPFKQVDVVLINGFRDHGEYQAVNDRWALSAIFRTEQVTDWRYRND